MKVSSCLRIATLQLSGIDFFMADSRHERLIGRCYALAEEAVRNGDHPFGALLVMNGEVVLTAVNTVQTDNDTTRHAEINLVARAERRFSPEELARSVLYTSTEPCAMCTGAIYAAGISAIVFGCSAGALYDLVGSDLSIPSREILALGQHTTTITGPILEEEGLQIHRGYWL
jgi:tRNA(Arg) A34 adenosine deaminase TadA